MWYIDMLLLYALQCKRKRYRVLTVELLCKDVARGFIWKGI